MALVGKSTNCTCTIKTYKPGAAESMAVTAEADVRYRKKETVKPKAGG